MSYLDGKVDLIVEYALHRSFDLPDFDLEGLVSDAVVTAHQITLSEHAGDPNLHERVASLLTAIPRLKKITPYWDGRGEVYCEKLDRAEGILLEILKKSGEAHDGKGISSQ